MRREAMQGKEKYKNTQKCAEFTLRKYFDWCASVILVHKIHHDMARVKYQDVSNDLKVISNNRENTF